MKRFWITVLFSILKRIISVEVVDATCELVRVAFDWDMPGPEKREKVRELLSRLGGVIADLVRDTPSFLLNLAIEIIVSRYILQPHMLAADKEKPLSPAVKQLINERMPAVARSIEPGTDVIAEAIPLSAVTEWWVLVARLRADWDWGVCGDLRRTRHEVEAQKQNWADHADYRIVRVLLPT